MGTVIKWLFSHQAFVAAVIDALKDPQVRSAVETIVGEVVAVQNAGKKAKG